MALFQRLLSRLAEDLLLLILLLALLLGGVVVTETLYRRHPDLSEGRLAKLRAAVVNARALAEVGLVPPLRHRATQGEEPDGADRRTG